MTNEIREATGRPVRLLREWVSRSPIAAFVVMAAAIFLAESLSGWIILERLPLLEQYEPLVEFALNTGVVLPVLLYLFVLPTARNIHRREATERELRVMHNELEHKVRERTLDLEQINRRLRQEVDERRRIQLAVEFQASLLDAVREAVVATDGEGRVLYWNRFAEQLYGWDTATALDGHLRDIVPYYQTNGELLDVLTECGQISGYSSEVEAERRDGQRFPAYLLCSRLSAGVDGYIYLSFDFTDRKRMETELRQLSVRLLTIQEEERRRVARDLHDSVGQKLSGIKFMVEAALGAPWPDERRSGIEQLRSLIPTIQDAVEEVRCISTALRPSILDDLGLLPTIDWHFREFGKMCPDIRVEKRLEVRETDVPAGLRTPIFRILQEASNNVAKHSRATHLNISLKVKGDSLFLRVHDDGIGFEQAATQQADLGGSGLSSMRERVELSGGSFSMSSVPDEGTTLEASWSLSGRLSG